jgi:hypothetical protein
MRWAAAVLLLSACSSDGGTTGDVDAALLAADAGILDAPLPPDAPRGDAALADATVADAGIDASPADAACPGPGTTAACADPPATGFGAAGVVTTAAVVRWSAVATDGASIYLAGTERLGSGDSGWRVEKRELASGNLVASFGPGGAVRPNPSLFLDRLELLSLDATSFYIAGSDATAGATAPRWRVEKRALADGALVDGFGDGGRVVLSPGGLELGPQGLARDATALYLAGREGGVSTTPQQWLVVKLALDDGEPVAGFGDAGHLRAHTVTPGASSLATRVLVADGDLLVGGQVAGALVVERRSAQTGALAAGFEISFAAGGAAPTALVDAGDAFFLAYPRASLMDTSWVIEKRLRATGALVREFGACGGVARDPTTGADVLGGVALAGDHLFLVAVDDLGSGGSWRWERRDAASGALRSLCASGGGGAVIGAPAALVLAPNGTDAIAAGAAEHVAQEAAGRLEKRRRP